MTLDQLLALPPEEKAQMRNVLTQMDRREEQERKEDTDPRNLPVTWFGYDERYGNYSYETKGGGRFLLGSFFP